MQFYTAADQVANGKVKLSTLFGGITQARAIILSCSGTGPLRFGDSNVGAAQGLQIAQGVSPTILRTTVGDPSDVFDLTTCFVNVPAGTTGSIIIGK